MLSLGELQVLDQPELRGFEAREMNEVTFCFWGNSMSQSSDGESLQKGSFEYSYPFYAVNDFLGTLGTSQT